MRKAARLFEELLDIMDELREKCPWDKKQSLESLRYLSIEECFELSDAILEKDMKGIRGELGDLMLHLVFYAKIASEQQAFDIADVLEGINQKLIRRHPHIYADVEANDADTVKSNWEKIKMKEGRKSVLEGIPKSMPSLVKAYRMQEKAAGIGFDWENADQVWDKVEEEMAEMHQEIKENNVEKMEEEYGDLLFALINYARFKEINPEDALEKANKKFIRRFHFLEEESLKDGKNLAEMNLDEMEAYWIASKKKGL
jgi:XTP/dITP diphosphohydrolase